MKKKRKAGQPPLFTSTSQLQDLMLGYLEKCKKEKLMPNRAGLCVEIDISRDSYYEYRKKSEFSDTIKRFEQATESIWVQRLGGNSPTGAIFYLKNAFKEDYRDKHEVEGSGLTVNLSFDPRLKNVTS